MTYEQPALGFDLNALEPHLDEENLTIHYNKHHNAYINGYNAAIEGTEHADQDIEEVLKNLNSISDDKRTVLTNMGGGAWNHSFFWSILTPEAESGNPGENTLKAINETFGDYDTFLEQFSKAAATVFGSGWAWLCVNKEGKLEIVKTTNQICPLSDGYKPILTLDVWEHAYYLKYRNLRPEYIKAFFKVVNWKKVEEYYNN